MLDPNERQELMDIAKALHLELRKISERVHLVVNKLISDYDATKLALLDEQSASDKPIVRGIKFSQAEADVPSLAVSDAPLGEGKRACSICRKPGHRSTTCPEAHKKYDAERGKKGKKK